MKAKLLLFLIISCFYYSCKNTNAVDPQIEKIISEYAKVYELKKPNIYHEFSSKQSYEIGFFKNNETDTLFYIVKMEAYAFKELSFLYSSIISKKLGLDIDRFFDYPNYMGSFNSKYNLEPIHVYDIAEKYGREYYNFNNLSIFNFQDFYITEEHLNIYTPNLWLYKIENNEFIKIAETDTMHFDFEKYVYPKDID